MVHLGSVEVELRLRPTAQSLLRLREAVQNTLDTFGHNETTEELCDAFLLVATQAECDTRENTPSVNLFEFSHSAEMASRD